jgi:hypothetical protein
MEPNGTKNVGPEPKSCETGTANIIYEIYRKQTSFGVVEMLDLCARILKSKEKIPWPLANLEIKAKCGRDDFANHAIII